MKLFFFLGIFSIPIFMVFIAVGAWSRNEDSRYCCKKLIKTIHLEGIKVDHFGAHWLQFHSSLTMIYNCILILKIKLRLCKHIINYIYAEKNA